MESLSLEKQNIIKNIRNLLSLEKLKRGAIDTTINYDNK